MMMPARRSPTARPAPRRRRALGLVGVEGLEPRQLLATVVAGNDTYQVIQDSLLKVAASGFLANDTPAPGETLTASVVTPPTNGALLLNPAGTFSYVPAPGYTGLDSFVYRATDATNGSATATVTLNVNPSVSRATVAAGTRLANLDTTQSALLNAVLGNLAGGAALNLSAVDNTALAQGSIRGGTLLNALQTNPGLATPDQALAADVTLPQLFAAAADAAQAEGNTALVTGLDNLALQLGGLNQTIRLGDLVNVVPNQGSFADASLNAHDLATGGIQLFNDNNVLATTTPVSVSGSALGLGSLVNNVALSATVVVPPVIVMGGVNTTFHTAGVRLRLAVDLVDQTVDTSALNSALVGLLGPLVTVNSALTVGDLDLVATVASGTGVITAIDDISRAVTLQTTPGVANVYLGTVSDATFFDRTSPIDPVADVAFGTIGSLAIAITGLITTGGTADLQARSSALGSAPLAGTLTFTPPYPETQVDGSSAAFLANLASTLATNLAVQTSGSFGGVLDPLVNGTVLPIVRPLVVTTLAPVLSSLLTGVVDPALTALGVGIGQEVVSVAAVGQSARRRPTPTSPPRRRTPCRSSSSCSTTPEWPATPSGSPGSRPRPTA